MNERQLKLIRIICPYINSSFRPHLMTFISFMELRTSIASINTPLEYLFSKKEPLITDREQLLNTLKCNVNKDEAQIIDNFLMMEQMMSLMEMMKEMQASDAGNNNSDYEYSEQSKTSSQASRESSSNQNAAPQFELLKSLLPKESAETFELVKMMMENNNES